MVDDSFVGRWRLRSYVARADDGSVVHPFGANPQGSLLYTAGGEMAVQVSATDRADFETNDFQGESESARAAAYSSYIAYCGTYDVTGDTIVHRVAISLFPNWVGSSQTRYYSLNGDELLLRSPLIKVGGTLLVHELRWQRDGQIA